MEQLLLFAEQEPPPKEYGPDMGRDPEAELKSMGFPIEIFWVADNPGSYDVPDKPTPMAIIELNGERTMTVWDCVAGNWFCEDEIKKEVLKKPEPKGKND